MAFLLTVGAVLFFVRPPAENHTWKESDNISVYFSDVERPTGAAVGVRRIANTCPSKRPIRDKKPERARKRDAGKKVLEVGLRGLGGRGRGMKVRLGLIHTVGCHACEALDLEIPTGITWRASERLTFTLVGQSLLKDHHLEANSLDQTEFSSLIKRSVYAKFTWQS